VYFGAKNTIVKIIAVKPMLIEISFNKMNIYSGNKVTIISGVEAIQTITIVRSMIIDKMYAKIQAKGKAIHLAQFE
ncbi:hypothetical protein, partial [Avibacterium avium]|uniref:hypothetical protein n=1 Tax=Avibacterium avium TaxID=751 RepID=UPI003BF8EF0C